MKNTRMSPDLKISLFYTLLGGTEMTLAAAAASTQKETS